MEWSIVQAAAKANACDLAKTYTFIKDALMPIPPIFKAIQKASKTSDEEMFRVYNMGHRLELYCPDDFAQTVIECSESFGINAKVIGRTEK